MGRPLDVYFFPLLYVFHGVRRQGKKEKNNNNAWSEFSGPFAWKGNLKEWMITIYGHEIDDVNTFITPRGFESFECFWKRFLLFLSNVWFSFSFVPPSLSYRFRRVVFVTFLQVALALTLGFWKQTKEIHVSRFH